MNQIIVLILIVVIIKVISHITKFMSWKNNLRITQYEDLPKKYTDQIKEFSSTDCEDFNAGQLIALLDHCADLKDRYSEPDQAKQIRDLSDAIGAFIYHK